MSKKLGLGLLVILMIFTIALFVYKNDSIDKTTDIKLSSNIEIGKKQYIEQLEKVPISGTNDYLIITEKRKWEVPEHKQGETVSVAIKIPYTIHVDGMDYSDEYCLGDCYGASGNDGNPKYDVKIRNLTKNYETEVVVDIK